MSGSKFDGLFRRDSIGGRAALERLKTLKVDDIFEDSLFKPFPKKVQWECRVAEANHWVLEGYFCGVPLYKVTVMATEASVAIKVTDLD